MKLIKTRPKIRLILPEWAHPGDRVVAEVVLEAKREVPIEFVQCTLTGSQRSQWGTGNQSRSYRLPVVALRAQPAEAGRLPPGASRFRCAFDLPRTLPPSYGGKRSAVEYVVAVHVSIAWWPDAKERFVLHVRPAPAVIEDAGRSLHSTSPEGPSGDEPHLEFSLHERHILPGDTVRGELALTNVPFNRYREVHLALVGVERVSSAEQRVLGTETAWRYAIVLDVRSAAEGEPMPFAMKLPEDLPPTFAATLTKLDWFFEVDAKLGWGKSIGARVPVAVLPKASKRQQAKSRHAVPTVGNPRVSAIWQEVGEIHGVTFEAQESRLVGKHGDVELTVTREHRGGDGIFLVGRLSFASLHLGLDGGVVTGLRRVFHRGLALDSLPWLADEEGLDAWQRRHYLAGRDDHQIGSFLEPLFPTLLGLRLADISDEGLTVELRDAGVTRAHLAGFVEDVKLLAGAVVRGRAAIPAPSQMRDAEPSWRALAQALGGRLETARMAVSGRFEGAAATVVTEWSASGEPRHTVIALEAEDAVAEKHALLFSEGRWVSGDLEELPQRARALIRELVEGAVSLSVEPERIELCVHAPLSDAAHVTTWLERLAALAATLRGQQGPYR